MRQFNTKEELRCLCGTAKCRGFLGVDVAADKLAEANAAAGVAPGGRGQKRGRAVSAAKMTKKARRRLLKKTKSMVRCTGGATVARPDQYLPCGCPCASRHLIRG